MNRERARLWLASAAAGVSLFAGTAVHAEDTTSVKDLQQKLESLQNEVAQLKKQQQEMAAAPTKEEVDATIARVMSDANKRSQVMDMEGFTAGYNKGKFVIQSADGNFSISPNLQMQFRNVTAMREHDEGGITNGFEMRRLRPGLAGNVFSPNITYSFQWETQRNIGNDTNFVDAGGVYLLEGWVRFKLNDDNAIQVGQVKDPVFREEIVSTKRFQTVEKSYVNELVGGSQNDYVQGIFLTHNFGNKLTGIVGYHDGANSDNTDYRDLGGNAGGSGDARFGVSGRVDYFIFGEDAKGEYDDFSALNNKKDILVVGGGADFTQGSDADVIYHTIDAQYETTGGFSVFAAYDARWRNFRDDATAVGENGENYDYGFLVQAGYFLNPKLEIFGRWDITFLDDAVPGAIGNQDSLNEFVVGANYYLQGHSLKLSLDLVYLPDGVPVAARGLGFEASDSQEFVLRTQLQLLL